MVEWENIVPVNKYPQRVNGKTMPRNYKSFLKFSAFTITHLFFTEFVQKACIGIKDGMKFNC
jgi:hypothetical protein